MTKIVIIGSSISGYTVAMNLRRLIADSSITIVSQSQDSFYDRRRLLDLISGTIKEKEIFFADEASLKDNSIGLEKPHKIAAVSCSRKQLYYKEKGGIEYDFLVIASGAKPVLPEIPGIKKEGVFSFYSLDDVRAISKLLIEDHVCVVGSDEFSLGLAKAISDKYKAEVKLLSNKVFDSALLTDKIEVIDSQPLEIIGEGQVQAVKLETGKIIAASAVVFCGNSKPAADFLRGTPVDLQDGFVQVDNSMCTSVREIFACGAVAAINDIPQVSIDWDECINQAGIVSENLAKIIKAQICQTC